MRFSSNRTATSRTLLPTGTETISVVMISPAVSGLGVTAGRSASTLDALCLMRSSPPLQGSATCGASRTRPTLAQRFNHIHAAPLCGLVTPADRCPKEGHPTSPRNTEIAPRGVGSETTQPSPGHRPGRPFLRGWSLTQEFLAPNNLNLLEARRARSAPSSAFFENSRRHRVRGIRTQGEKRAASIARNRSACCSNTK